MRPMKIYLSAALALALVACGQPAPEKVEDVAANNMAEDEVTEVADESAMPAPDNDDANEAEDSDNAAR
jgi:hypothetical protein